MKFFVLSLILSVVAVSSADAGIFRRGCVKRSCAKTTCCEKQACAKGACAVRRSVTVERQGYCRKVTRVRELKCELKCMNGSCAR